jgi:hypothetical protein
LENPRQGEIISSEGEVELRLTTTRLRPSRRTRAHVGHVARLAAFWIVPVVLVLGLAYMAAGR